MLLTTVFQFGIAATDSYHRPYQLLQNQIFYIIIILAISLPIVFFVLSVIRRIVRQQHKQRKAFNRVVLQIQVPKERKSEGQGGQVSGEDRLEQIKEEIAITETLFANISGLKPDKSVQAWFRGRNDHLSFEIVVHNHLIYFYVDIPLRWKQFIEQQIHAQYPYAQVEEMTDYNIFSEKSTIIGAYLKAAESSVFPFKTFKTMDSDPLSAILNVLARVFENNSSAAVQFVMRSAGKDWRAKGIKLVREVRKGKKFEKVMGESFFAKAMRTGAEIASEAAQKQKDSPEAYQLSSREEEMLKGIEDKISKGGVETTVRLLSVSDNEVTAKLNLDNLINAFSQYNLYRFGNSFKAVVPRNQKNLIQEFIYRTLNHKYKDVFNTEEIASLWHLPLHSTEAPNIKWLTGRSAPPPANLPTEGLSLGYVDYRGQKTEVKMKEADRRRHLYIIGKSGSGKSVLISNLVRQDILHGKGVCVVDPHGDLVEKVLSFIPKERADDVVLFDPSDMEKPVGLNMLEAKTEDQKDFAVQEMISIFYKLFPPEMIGPMFEHNMRNVMLTLMADMENPGTVIDIPRMFTDDNYVKIYLAKLKDPVVRAFWEQEMAKTSDFHKSEMLGYLISKVGRFVENEMMRNIMGQQKSGFSFREIMDEQKILLVNLAKGRTGEVNAKLLGLIVVAKLQMAAMARADIPEEQRQDFYLYIDEFQNFVTDSIATILSEARKYKLNLIIAHQYMGQLIDEKGSTNIRDAVLGNAGTLCSARIGPDDAEILAKEFAPTFGAYDLINSPKYSYYTKLLIDNTASRPFLMKSNPPQAGDKKLGAAIKELARLKYGRDREIVEAEIMERTQLGKTLAGSSAPQAEATA